MSQHHCSRQDHSCWIGQVFIFDVQTNVSATWLENCMFSTEVCTWNKTWSPNKSGTNIRQDGTIKIWCHHDIKLLWVRNSLHRSIVHNHVLDFNVGILRRSDILHGSSEQTVTKFHNVGFMNSGNKLSVVFNGKIKSKPSDSFCLVFGHNLQRFHNPRDRLMLETRILTLGVLSHQHEVNIL
ncbi:hypothetical protein OGAPHI_006417 [Ogataea philodendri]|uniref:Uncharacterized protein n=1 Tax=Ogataea philodendri TaxID=1378263 RepID=A0A9P8NY37_9ASCO|nr:uncharacterized protein OGAPHI_006417 [Ogataea philodendri]KAH3661569.1 hypothetical protein OGAPHI_006417 [Ogataea philodendri]